MLTHMAHSVRDPLYVGAKCICSNVHGHLHCCARAWSPRKVANAQLCVFVCLCGSPRAGDSQPHGEGHGDLRGGAGSHRHHAESGAAHQRHEEEARARRQAAGAAALERQNHQWLSDFLLPFRLCTTATCQHAPSCCHAIGQLAITPNKVAS